MEDATGAPAGPSRVRNVRRPRRSRLGRRLLALALLALLGSPLVLAWLAVEGAPAVLEAPGLATGDPGRAKALARHAVRELVSGKASTTLVYTEQDLNALMALASRAVPRLSGRVNVGEVGLYGAMSYALPGPLGGRYVNVRAALSPSTGGLAIESLRLGRIPVPASLALAAARLAGDLALGEDEGGVLLDGIDAVEFAPGRMTVHVRPPPDLRARLRVARDRARQLRDEVALLGDPAVVREYYQALVDAESAIGQARSVSLARYVAATNELARQRSRDRDAAEENQAAILALVTYLGDPRFESLIGPVRTGSLAGHRRPRRTVVLAGRQDLALHFVISAGLKVAADRGISTAIGEFKELLDTGRGGSGFSFVDLAADRAGVRFAEVATARDGARRLQRALAGDPSERAFFPPVDGLPEGFSEQAFEARFGTVTDPRYAAMVADIDERIAALPAFRATDRPANS